MAYGERRDFFAVLCQQADGTGFLACGSDSTPRLFFRRKDAVQYARELRKYLASPVRVIRVDVNIRELATAGGER